MRRPFKNRKQLVVSVEQKYFDFLIHKCIELSEAEGYPISVSEITRRALEHYFPLPGTMDMLGEVNNSNNKYQKR